ncbi:MAG: M20/M25/M40 family metallo-hydrolase, partial [Deltaproteobacteria bacterium]|nr:M20/M25/M40 family metallo-hydrolase [Deltaproteobacteria bacterium]
LASLGADIVIDDAGEKIGGDTGNLIARFKGNTEAATLLLNAHMDTVEPGRGIVPVFTDGVFTSQGDTILGADDKSAIAIILEVLKVVGENNLACGPLEVVFTICEEIGLLGAKYLDFNTISANYGFALDSADTRGVVTRAPSANHLEFTVHGKEAHAGAAPEKGINAIQIAGKAIADLDLGRIDAETTCNIGVIEGGLATNIVPNLVKVKGEVRSHDDEKLAAVTKKMVSAFSNAAAAGREKSGDTEIPHVDTLVEHEFTRTHIPEDHPMIALAVKAAGNLDRTMTCKTTGGGADANVFFQHGIVTGVLGTGMQNMHTANESVRLDAMVDAAELLLEILRLHAQGDGS